KKSEAETARDHCQDPIVTIASIDRLAVDTEVIEHTIHHVIELAERSLHIRLAGEVPDLNGFAIGKTMPGRQHDHHLLPKQRQIVKAGIPRPIWSAVDRSLRFRADE